jgi:hypothetical protein
MSEISIDQVNDFQNQFLDRMRAGHQDVLDLLGAGKIDEGISKTIEDTAQEVIKSINCA